MNNFYVFILVLIITSCSNMVFPTCFSNPCVAVPGETKLDDSNKSYVAATSFELVKFSNPSCSSYKNYKVINTTVDNYINRKGGPKWVEIWTIEACDEQWAIPVILYSNNHSKDVIVSTKDIYKIVNGRVDKSKFWTTNNE